ncbi:MAG: DUF2232 domain-containing protein, partial [Rickettsiales bacterium]
MSKQMISILITALLSGGIFLIIIDTGLGFVLLFLSTLPIFSIGLSESPKSALKAAAIATIPISLLVTSFYMPLIFFLMFALPCWYICYMALRYYDIQISKDIPPVRLWYPIVLITMYLAIYACILLAIITAIYATKDINLPQQITLIIQDGITNLSKDFAINIEADPKSLSFIWCGIFVWMWGILLLGHAWFMNSRLVKKKMAKRPNFALTPFFMPHWLLTLIGICALASLIGGESMRFLGKSSLIILLFPYFFQGIAMLHSSSQNWPNRRLLIFFFYFLLATQFWIIIAVAGVGLWHHIK